MPRMRLLRGLRTVAELGAICQRGMRRLGSVYFPDFANVDSGAAVSTIVATLDDDERRELVLLLTVAAFAPRSLFRLLFRCEDETRTGMIWRALAPIHIQIKGLCALVYFAALDANDGGQHD